jgi:long-subunit fatty acid transport protein
MLYFSLKFCNLPLLAYMLSLSKYFLGGIFILPAFGYTAFEKLDVGAQSIALGNAVVARRDNFSALYYNPAGLTQPKNIQVVLSQQNFFGLSELTQSSIITNFELADFPISTGFSQLGNNLYKEYTFSIGSLYRFSQQASVGMSAHYYGLYIHDYGQTSTWGICLGFLYAVAPNFTIGSMITNINQPKISTDNEKLPQSFSLGLCYYPDERWQFNLELFRDIRYKNELCIGIAYNISSQLFMRFGIIDQSNSYALGVGTKFLKMIIDYALTINQLLGVSHIFTFTLDL